MSKDDKTNLNGKNLQSYSFPFEAMGSSCEVKLYSYNNQEAERVAKLVISGVVELQNRYSRYVIGNLMYRINQAAAAGHSIEVNTETAALLDYANTCFKNSDGLFDISSGVLRQAWDFNSGKLPGKQHITQLLQRIGWQNIIWEKPRLSFKRPGMELDFGGIVKEYAADFSAGICLQAGVYHGLINLGGDIRVIGPHPNGAPWTIGIRDPRNKQRHYTSIQVSQGGICSSGDYDRCIKIADHYYSHILNPKTGWPVAGLATVTVIADYCLVAGSLSTIAMLKEKAGKTWLQENGIAALWVDIEGNYAASEAAQQFQIIG